MEEVVVATVAVVSRVEDVAVLHSFIFTLTQHI